LNKLENHYKEKKKVFQEKFLKNEENFVVTFSPDEKICKNVNFLYYSLRNYVKLLSYYIDEKNSKEIKEIASINEKPEELVKKKLNDVFLLWCFTNFFEENIQKINRKIEEFFQNDYSKALPNVRSFIKSAFSIEIDEKPSEIKKKFNDNEFLFQYKMNDINKNPGFKLWFEKMAFFNEFQKPKKISEMVWMVNEKQISVFLKKLCIEVYLLQVNDLDFMIKSCKDPKKKESLKEKLKILRMIYIVGLEKKGFPTFYLKELLKP